MVKSCVVPILRINVASLNVRKMTLNYISNLFLCRSLLLDKVSGRQSFTLIMLGKILADDILPIYYLLN